MTMKDINIPSPMRQNKNQSFVITYFNFMVFRNMYGKTIYIFEKIVNLLK